MGSWELNIKLPRVSSGLVGPNIELWRKSGGLIAVQY